MAKRAREMPEKVQGAPERSGKPTSEERRCQVCGMRLSSYNPGPNCWQHTIGFPWRGPTAKPRY